MRMKWTRLYVNDQEKALQFYTDVLGFRKKHDVPAGPFRWITVVSPEGPDELELVLEPNANPAAQAFQTAMFEQGVPLAAFESGDIEADVSRLKERSVAFTREPTRMGPVTIAIFSDTCGNLIQLYQPDTGGA
jgi:glyoxylase I family protein